MTKKLICPSCKEELEEIKEHTQEYRVYRWAIINNQENEVDVIDEDCYDSDTQFFECEGCGYHGGSIEEFIVEEET